MKNIYSVNKITKVITGNSTNSGIYDRDTEDLYYTDNNHSCELFHESGTPRLMIVDNIVVARPDSEIQKDTKYKTWFNLNIEAQLERLDIKRIRPSADINDDDTTAQDKTAAKAALKTLNAQAAALRAQLIK